MRKVLFATGNESKAKRFKNGLLKNNIEIITINDIEQKVEVDENGENSIENALIKARAYASTCDYPVFAMDDNLYLEGIPKEKQPGMYVRRVNGKRLTDEEMIEYYSKLAHDYGKNGKVERSHRKDQERFYYKRVFYSLEDLRNQGKEWRKEYNNFPMRPLGWLSPREFIKKYKSQEESLFAI